MPGQEQVVEATIQGIEPQGNGWVQINTDQGPFSTKFPEPVAEAQAHLGQRVLIAYEIGQARQRQDGSYWPTPRYFKRISTPGYVSPQTAPQPQQYPQHPQQQPQPFAGQPSQGQDNDPDRALRIMRQTAAKCAVWTMQLVPSEQRTFQNQLAVAEAWMRYFIGGLEGTGVSLGGAAALSQEQQMAMAGAPGDDIPF